MADVDSSKLKPCPFCGDTQLGAMDMTYMHASGPTKGKRIKCQTCGAQAPDTCWNARLTEDELRARIAELELLADDARGKRCPECSAPMVSLSTIDGGQRVCSGCDKVWSWHLKEGQPPLIGNNRMVKKV